LAPSIAKEFGNSRHGIYYDILPQIVKRVAELNTFKESDPDPIWALLAADEHRPGPSANASLQETTPLMRRLN
jgi:hypothetical protein